MKNLLAISTLLLCLNVSASVAPCGGEDGSYYINVNGERGGFVAATAVVESTVFLGKNVQICGNAMVLDRAEVTGYAIVKDHAKVYDSARVFGNAMVYENAEVYNTAAVWQNAQAYGQSRIYGFAGLRGNVKVYGIAHMFDATYSSGIYF